MTDMRSAANFLVSTVIVTLTYPAFYFRIAIPGRANGSADAFG